MQATMQFTWPKWKRRLRLAKSAAFGRNRFGEAGWYEFAQGRAYSNRTALLTHMAIVYGYQSYLEIGVRRNAANLDRVPIDNKVGVDPDPKADATFPMTSDDFFAQNGHLRFDLIFIDGLHTGEQVARDIGNALAALNPGGAILLHDLNPPTAFDARDEYEVEGQFPAWCGSSWQGFVRYRATRPDLEMYVVDTDWGVGFIRPGRQRVYSGPYETFADLDRDRDEMLNLITVRDFLSRHPAKRRKWSVADRFFG